jgi:hydrogenase/urease accessory protein HupE
MPAPDHARARLGSIFIGAAIGFAPGSAEAHTAFKSLGSFWSGSLHVLTSFDQIGLMLGLAIWASLQRKRRDAAVVGAACLGALLGSLFGWGSSSQFETLLYVAATMFLIGGAGAVALDVGRALLISVAACSGALIGLASEMGRDGMQPGLFALGAAIAAASAVSYGLIAVSPSYPDWVKIALRAGASWIAAIGLMIFALEASRLRGHA